MRELDPDAAVTALAHPEYLARVDAIRRESIDAGVTGIPTFFRAPYTEDLSEVDIALVGVPYDGGVTNRPGARHGPREVRNASSLIRRLMPCQLYRPVSASIRASSLSRSLSSLPRM